MKVNIKCKDYWGEGIERSEGKEENMYFYTINFINVL